MKEKQNDEPKTISDRKDAGTLAASGVLGRIIDYGGIIFATGIFLAMLILIQEVILRYLFNAPTIWAHETTVFLCAIAFIYGGLYCTARDSHIRVVLLYDLTYGRVRRILDALISLICMIASICFTWAGWLMVRKAIFRPDGSIHFETSGSAWDPAFPAYLKLFLLMILGLMALQFLILTINYGRAALTLDKDDQ